MKRLKEKWNIKSNFQLLIILFVLSVTGSLSLLVVKPLLGFLLIEEDLLPPWVFWPVRVLILFPVYQLLILIVGALFGQFKFFWAFEKKLLARLGFKQFKDTE